MRRVFRVEWRIISPVTTAVAVLVRCVLHILHVFPIGLMLFGAMNILDTVLFMLETVGLFAIFFNTLSG